jgi:hypothetical protein
MTSGLRCADDRMRGWDRDGGHVFGRRVSGRHAPRSKRTVPEAVEITTFRLADALNMRDFIEANRDIGARLLEQPGFVSAASASMRAGHIADMLVWTSQEAGQMAVTGVVTEMAHSPVPCGHRPVRRRLVDLAGPSRSAERRCRPLIRRSGCAPNGTPGDGRRNHLDRPGAADKDWRGKFKVPTSCVAPVPMRASESEHWTPRLHHSIEQG